MSTSRPIPCRKWKDPVSEHIRQIRCDIAAQIGYFAFDLATRAEAEPAPASGGRARSGRAARGRN